MLLTIFNTGRLAGLLCPACQSRQPFNIDVRSTATMYDDGSDIHNEIEWQPHSRCVCVNCGLAGTIREFKEACEAAHDVQSATGDALMRHARQPATNAR